MLTTQTSKPNAKNSWSVFIHQNANWKKNHKTGSNPTPTSSRTSYPHVERLIMHIKWPSETTNVDNEIPSALNGWNRKAKWWSESNGTLFEWVWAEKQPNPAELKASLLKDSPIREASLLQQSRHFLLPDQKQQLKDAHRKLSHFPGRDERERAHRIPVRVGEMERGVGMVKWRSH